MPMKFAAARTPDRSPVARALARRSIECVANDNGYELARDEVMKEALRHFAEHGMGAARAARLRAEEAFFAGDRDGYDWWLAICRKLDRRLAAELERRSGSKTA